MGQIERTVEEQARYYRERAGEYDDWWLRRGRYDRGARANALWNAEVASLERVVDALGPLGALAALGWRARVRTTGEFFLYGQAERMDGG